MLIVIPHIPQLHVEMIEDNRREHCLLLYCAAKGHAPASIPVNVEPVLV